MDNTTEYKALNLNQSQQQQFIRFHNSLPTKAASTIRFFNRTDYYTLHGDDANLAANILSMNVAYMGNQPKLSYLCLNKGRFEMFLRDLLLIRQYRVEVYVRSSQNEWIIEYRGSPGNFSQFEEILFDNVDIDFTNSVMGVKLCANNVVAICSINMTDVHFEVCELNDNDSFLELETVIIQIGPKECVIPSGETSDLAALRKVLNRNGILVANMKKSDFACDEIFQDLNRLLYFAEDQQRNAAAYTETNLKEAMSCLQAVIRFLNLTGDSKNFNQYKLTTLDAHRFVRLDNSALYALNIFPKSQSQSSDGFANQTALKTNSLKGLLDYCVTPQGRRLLEQWIKQPLKDYNLINERLDIVEAFVKDPESKNMLMKDKLGRMVDLIPLSKKLASKKTTLQDCYRIYLTITTIPSIVNILKNIDNKCMRDMLTNPLCEIISDVDNFQKMVEQTLDFDLVERGEYLVKSSFSEELSNLRSQTHKLEEKMQKLLLKVADDLGLDEGKGVKLECNDTYGFYFRITLKAETTLRKRKEYKILDTIKNGVKFTNGKLSDLNEEYQSINREYRDQQKVVEAEIFEVALGYADTLRTLNSLISKLDVLLSFAAAAVSAKIPYVRPRLHKPNSGILNLKKLRHPCLEAQDNISIIPNDVSFSSDGKILHVITGPNMCGKSTYIRGVGTCVLMAHIGSLVPCELADISMVDAILVRVGADDCQLKGLSTFMLEMIETAAIIKNATSNSLVIIDELGRGTSTYDGCGIAWAIVEHLVKEVKCFSLFATHFHEIIQLADIYDCISNLHVTAVVKDDTFVPLYQIQTGECDKSYGVHCAKMVGFPDDVLKDAVEYQDKLEHSSGLKYISTMDPTVKRRCIAEGDEYIEKTMNSIRELQVDKISDDELMETISKLKSDLASNPNLFLKGLIS